jgi:hypothetical protein
MRNWYIESLKGKYYGTKVTNGKDSIVIWTSHSGEVSEREILDGWTEEVGFDHTESAKDYKYAQIIVEALNKEE